MKWRDRIYDATGLTEICERDRVGIRRGMHRKRTGRVTYIRRVNGNVRVHVQIEGDVAGGPVGVWLSPRSMEVDLAWRSGGMVK